MDDIINFLSYNNYIIVILAAIVCLVALVAVVKRLLGFIATLVLLTICAGAAWVAAYPNKAIDTLKHLSSKEEVKEAVESLQENLIDLKDRILPPKGDSLETPKESE